jgi:glucose/arabinose dehydrogenase/PKD repeat protein
MGICRLKLIIAILICISAGFAAAQVNFADPRFVSERVAGGLRAPMGLAFAPDGRLFAWEKDGTVRIVKNGVLLPTPFVDLRPRVNKALDRGLTGLALDPNFPENGFVYLAYVFENGNNPNDEDPKTQRVVRVKANPANPDVALAGSETILLGSISTPPCANFPEGADCIPSDVPAHTIDHLHFGADGTLYVSNGDGASFSGATTGSLRAQNLNSYSGKLLRINRDGTAPPDNPFSDGTNSSRSKVVAYGLRNPYRFTLHPQSGEPYIGDVGWTKFDEINRGRGVNFGWPCYEGADPQAQYQSKFEQCRQLTRDQVVAPQHFYQNPNGQAIILGDFLPVSSPYPPEFHGNLFFADFVEGWIDRAVLDSAGNVAQIVRFASNIAQPVYLELGPDGMLYYVSIGSGEIRRIRFTGSSNRAPVAVASANPTSGFSPLDVIFSSAGSSDPDGGALTFSWDFGDGNTSTLPNPTHRYTAPGVAKFTAKLTVKDPEGVAAEASVQITVGSTPPAVTIAVPADGSGIRVGQRVEYRGSATDAEDGNLPGSALAWRVLLHHNTHQHMLQDTVGETESFTVLDHDPVGTFSYEIILTATDKSGLSTTKSIRLPVDQTKFTISASPPTAMVKQGQTAQYSLTFTAQPGFNGNAALSCSGLPQGANCSFNPGSITLGSQPVSSTLQVATGGGAALGASNSGTSLPIYAALIPMLGLLVGLRRVRSGSMTFIALVLVFLLLAGCGSESAQTSGPAGVQPGTYEFTIVGTPSSGQPSTTKATLGVQQ